MCKPFQKGDRVKFVGPIRPAKGTHLGSWEHTPQIAEVQEARFDRLYVTAFGRSEWDIIHPRQVTHRIIPRKKPLALPITREQIAKAWNFHCQGAKDILSADKDIGFDYFCIDLGFPAQEKGKRE